MASIKRRNNIVDDESSSKKGRRIAIALIISIVVILTIGFLVVLFVNYISPSSSRKDYEISLNSETLVTNESSLEDNGNFVCEYSYDEEASYNLGITFSCGNHQGSIGSYTAHDYIYSSFDLPGSEVSLEISFYLINKDNHSISNNFSINVEEIKVLDEHDAPAICDNYSKSPYAITIKDDTSIMLYSLSFVLNA